MNFRIIGIGKTTDQHIQRLCEDYLQRLKHYATVEVEFLDIKKKYSQADQKIVEGELMLSKIQKASIVVLLDETGKSISSKSFAAFVQKRLNAGSKEVIFLIGGAYGFSEEIYQRADFKIALSPMTFTHQMVRLIFLEQLYRAFTILKGEKYHH